MGTLLNRRRYMGGGSADEIIMASTSNPEVMAICYAQGWSANADYMTKREAEAVTNIGTAFYNNTSITHFEEFEYFTSVTSLANNAFRGCSNLTSITLPYTITTLGERTFQADAKLSSINLSNVEKIGNLCFYNCTSLVDVDISGCITLEQGAFTNCSNLETLTSVSNIVKIGSGNEGAFQSTKISGSLLFTSFAGSTIPVSLLNGTPVADVQFPSSNYTSIGAFAFRNTHITSFVVKNGCTTINNHSLSGSYFKLIDLPSTLTTWNGWVMYQNTSQEVIICRASTPPTINSSAFSGVPSSCKVYVPSASISSYETATGWSKFAGRYIALEGSIYE